MLAYCLNMKTRNAATNKGTCQCCGAAQKLPAGVLAKHGYTVRWGVFSGICQGSGEKPFEKSTDLIARFIKYAEEKRAELEAFQAELLARPAEGTTEAWVHVYRSGNRVMRSGYVWMKLPLVFTVHTSSSSDYQWLTVQYADQDTQGRMQREECYGVRGLDPLDFVAHLNQKRAQALAKDIEKMTEYICWQQRRVAEWKEQDLLPV